MITTILLMGALYGGASLKGATNEEALKAVQELYQYSTNSVQVESDTVQEMVARIEGHLAEPEGETARAFEQLVAEARRDQPDGRELRVLARELYVAIESAQDEANA
jgi:hypothetical protein